MLSAPCYPVYLDHQMHNPRSYYFLFKICDHKQSKASFIGDSCSFDNLKAFVHFGFSYLRLFYAFDICFPVLSEYQIRNIQRTSNTHQLHIPLIRLREYALQGSERWDKYCLCFFDVNSLFIWKRISTVSKGTKGPGTPTSTIFP